MNYSDRIWGQLHIDDNVLIDVMATEEMQRLKKVDQAGYFETWFPHAKMSRFEHSVGCMILLQKFGGTIEEQISGLIHDMSHTVFSHVSDYVFSSGSATRHSYQDDIFESFVKKSSVWHILKEYKLNRNDLIKEDFSSLQETDLPQLCADRIDYSLRAALVFRFASQKTIKSILHHLQTQDHIWVFDDYDVAMKYVYLFKKLNDKCWAGKESAAMFQRTADWLKYAMDKEYITEADLFTTDDNVIALINKNNEHDQWLQKLWNAMNNPRIIFGNKNDVDVVSVDVKSRVIDPTVVDHTGIYNVSQKNREWRKVIDHDQKAKTYYFKKI